MCFILIFPHFLVARRQPNRKGRVTLTTTTDPAGLFSRGTPVGHGLNLQESAGHQQSGNQHRGAGRRLVSE